MEFVESRCLVVDEEQLKNSPKHQDVHSAGSHRRQSKQNSHSLGPVGKEKFVFTRAMIEVRFISCRI